MKKITVLFLVSSFIFILINQASFSQIKLQIGPQIGYTSSQVDYSGATTDFYAGTKYGFGSSINYGALARVGLGPLGAKLSVTYSSFSNSGTADPTEPNSTVQIKSSVLTFGVGTEFGFGIPFSPIRPYAGIDLLFSTFTGSFQFQNTSTANLNSNSNSLQSSSRTGLGFCIGGEYKASKSMSVDLSLHYNLLNLFGKSYTGTTRLDVYSYLNDAADPNYSAGDPNHPIGNNRSIAMLQIQLAVLFGL